MNELASKMKKGRKERVNERYTKLLPRGKRITNTDI
jgi:hypothetical protein